jgi:hypothetical protein
METSLAQDMYMDMDMEDSEVTLREVINNHKDVKGCKRMQKEHTEKTNTSGTY